MSQHVFAILFAQSNLIVLSTSLDDDSRRVVQKVEPSTTRSPSPVVSSAPLDKGKGKMVYAEDSTNLPFSPPSNKADGSFEQPGPSHSRSTPPHLLPLKPVDLPSTPGLTTSTRVQPTPQRCVLSPYTALMLSNFIGSVIIAANRFTCPTLPL